MGVQVQMKREWEEPGHLYSSCPISQCQSNPEPILRYIIQKLMESQPIKGATYAIASAFRLVSAFRYITVHHPQTLTVFTFNCTLYCLQVQY